MSSWILHVWLQWLLKARAESNGKHWGHLPLAVIPQCTFLLPLRCTTFQAGNLGRTPTLRPESQDEVFCTIFLHQLCERSRKLMPHCSGHLSAILLHNPRENENQCLKSLAELLQGNRTELCFASKFSESCRSQRRKVSFENIETQNTRKYRRSQRKKWMRHKYQAKMLWKILPLLI